MKRARVVLFGSGSPLSVVALRTLVEGSDVTALVLPSRGPIRSLRSAAREALRELARRPLIRLARRLAVAAWRYPRGGGPGLEAAILAAEPDVISVASFPLLLPPSLLRIPRFGAIGVHPSLLPRHRGPEPLFWTYFHDDPEAGVTVHWLDAGEDTGDVVYQETVSLPRGRDVSDLYEEIARRGARLLARAVAEVVAGVAPRIPQDGSRATREPLPHPGSWRIDYCTWGAERVWHFLRGLGGRDGRLLRDPEGHIVPHGPPLAFALERHDRPPGTMERSALGWRVMCHDGFVDVAGPRLVTRSHVLAGKLLGSRV